MPERPNGMVSKTIEAFSLAQVQILFPPPIIYLAIVNPHTFSTPARFNTLTASFIVDPVVQTSSNKIILETFNSLYLELSLKTPVTFLLLLPTETSVCDDVTFFLTSKSGIKPES